MKLDPGYYKVKMRNSGFSESYHILRVLVINKRDGKKEKYYQMDNGIPERIQPDDENYELNKLEIVRRLTVSNPIEYKDATIQVNFKDQDGDRFEFRAKKLPVFEKLLSQFPRLKSYLD